MKLRIYVQNDHGEAPYRDYARGHYYEMAVPDVSEIATVLSQIVGNVREFVILGKGGPNHQFPGVPMMFHINGRVWGVRCAGRILVRGHKLHHVLEAYQALSQP